MITTTVVGSIIDPSGNPVDSANVTASLNEYDYDAEFGWVENRRISTETDENGDFSFELWPNTRGTEGTEYLVRISSPNSRVFTEFRATIPEQDVVDLIVASDFDPVPPKSDAEILIIEAQGYVADARSWATSLDVVGSGLFGARFYAQSAENSADTASQSASSANTSASQAQTSATSAITAKNAAQAAQTASESALDAFTDQYLGSKAAAPTTDNDDDPLQEGALYWDSTDSQLYVWDGSAWDQAAFNVDGSVVSFNGRDGAVTLLSSDVTNALGYTPQDQSAAYDSTDFDTDFGNKTTDNLTEGSTNLYYTDSKVRNAVSAAGDLSYDPATGVFSFTETANYTDSDVDAHLTGGTGVTYNSGNISIGQDISPSSNVTFNEITASSVKDSSSNTMLSSVVSTGQVALSSGEATVATGVSATDATFMLALGIDDPNSDAEVAGSLFWDDSAGQYYVKIKEVETSVNPTVNYDVIRVR